MKSTGADSPEEYVSGCDFGVTGDRLILYRCPMVEAPEPHLEAIVHIGGEAEGWAIFLITQGESNLMLVVNAWKFNFSPKSVRYIALDEGATVSISPELASIKPTDLGKERNNPAPRKEKVITEDWEISVIEAIRGEEAWKMAKEANQFNEPPAEGMEYIAVKIHIRYIGTEERIASIYGASFKTTGSANVLYDMPDVVDNPLDVISLYPGGEYEGWIFVQAAKDETGIILIFDSQWDFNGNNKRFISLEP